MDRKEKQINSFFQDILKTIRGGTFHLLLFDLIQLNLLFNKDLSESTKTLTNNGFSIH